MRFVPTEEQVMFRDSVRRFVADEYPFDKRLKIVEQDPGYLPEHWQTFAELGWLAVPFPEELGGLGGSAFDVAVLMEEFGRGLVVSPYLSTVVLSGRLLIDAGSDSARALIGEIIAGTAQVSTAIHETQARYDLHDVATRADRSGQGWEITGRKIGVPFGGTADRLIVAARTGGGQRDRDGISLFLVDAKAKGVAVHSYRTHDGGSAAVVEFARLAVSRDELLGPLDGGLPLLERAADIASAALAAETVGAMEAAQQATVAYAKTRRQFDQNLGQFQALQHRMVDMFIAYEQAKSMACLACSKADSAESEKDRKRAISAAKIKIADNARLVSQESVQLHGGMGMTEELKVSHTFRRLTVIIDQFGGADYHLERFASL